MKTIAWKLFVISIINHEDSIAWKTISCTFTIDCVTKIIDLQGIETNAKVQ